MRDFAKGFGPIELQNLTDTIDKYMEMPLPGKIINRKISSVQIFHKGVDDLYFLFVTDLIDSLQYIKRLMDKTIEKFQELFRDPLKIKETSSEKDELSTFLNHIQKDLHSKISIIGPTYAGKTTLYNLLKSDEEKIIMDFAISTTIQIEGLSFDLWNFRLKDNFSNLWSKMVRESDLIILLFNLANYNLKIMNHFMNMHKQETNSAKFIIIGNKRELVDDEDIKRIRNELNFNDFSEISLNSPDAKAQIQQIIKEMLGLKERLPSNFEKIVKEAEGLVSMGNTLHALAKYRELVKLCTTYQDFEHIKLFEQKVADLTTQLKEQKELRKEIDKEKAFAIPKELKFKKKISVKPLPTTALPAESFTKEEIEEELPPPPKRLTSEMVSFKKLDSKPAGLKLLKTSETSPILKKPSIPLKTSETQAKTSEVRMPMEIFAPHEELSKDIKKPQSEDFTKELQTMILEKGSSLSLKLCEQLITELAQSLGRRVTIDDVKLAADFFVKQEQMV
ncbi:MAG: ADP-ribosylation factor-like protein [Promethearchaeota archaeon]